MSDFYGDIGVCGHLLVMRADDVGEWVPRFCILLAKEIRCFESVHVCCACTVGGRVSMGWFQRV
jgi:hypothetical protein